MRTSSDKAIASSTLRLSVTLFLSRYGIVAGAAPGVASGEAPGGEPAPPERPIAPQRGDCIGRAARPEPAARRQDARRPHLPSARDEDQGLRDHGRPAPLFPSSPRRRGSRTASEPREPPSGFPPSRE